MKRNVNIVQFVRDVRAGKSDVELMGAHGLDARGLLNTFEKMVDLGVLSREELGHREGPEPEMDGPDRRRARRGYLVMWVPVHDATDTTIQGRLNDVSDTGLQVAGLRSKVGQTHRLVVDAGELTDIRSFVVAVECVWVNPEDESGEYLAGFKIRTVSAEASQALRKLAEALSFLEDRQENSADEIAEA